jgi:hypothetical protein
VRLTHKPFLSYDSIAGKRDRIDQANGDTMMLSGAKLKLIFIGAALGLTLLAAGRFFLGSSKAESGSGRIEGIVLNEQRQPLSEVVIVIAATTARGSYPEIAPVTNEKGEFSFSHLPAGEYTLRAARTGFKDQTLVVKVEEKKTASAELVMRR